MPDNKQVQGLDSKTLEEQGRKSLEDALGAKKEELSQQQETEENQKQESDESQQTQSSSQQQQQVEQSSEQQDATSEDDNELAKYDNILKQTFGFSEDNITDEARKVAKSWSELQSKTTKVQQEKKEYQRQLQQFNQLFEKDPTLYEHANAVAKGQSYENPNQQDSRTEQPQQKKGQLDSESVDEQTLIKQGYIKESELEGLDDLARDKKLMKAELQYEKDRMRNEFRSELQEERENLTKQEEAEKIKELNEQRLTQGLDNFVTQTGFNLAELDDDTFQEIQQSAIWDRDHQDPRVVKEDAFETAARRVLSRKGLLNQQQEQNQQNKKQQMQDTGATVNQQTNKQNRNKSLGEELRDRAAKNFANSYNDPKKQFFQK